MFTKLFILYKKREVYKRGLGKEKKLDKRATTKNAIEINSSEELYKQADINLYEAKRSGRNCVVIK